jgi:S-adenosylmethionine:tRNA ribosyltransferase-isomerase
VRTSDFDYQLPPELIAQTPLEPRDSARLLVVGRDSGSLRHALVRDLPDLLQPGDLLVLNRSRVLPARVRGRLKGGGQAELLLLRRLAPGHWQALARPARRLRPGDTVEIRPDLRARIVASLPEGVREVAVDSDGDLLAAGSTPLPPYIRGWTGDPERYQTVYADTDGSAAAPTAGLHFTPDLLARLEDRGIQTARLVLHIGLDTFRPVDDEDPRQHAIHQEWYVIPEALQQQVQAARRVIAVGTTSVRALEAWAATGRTEGWTDLFILPGFQFRVVDGLLTNFHLPRSSLLMLVSAFAGRERILAAYAEAVRHQYRFYSFGDAMLLA